MGKSCTCYSCDTTFDTGELANPYGVEKRTFECPNCGSMNNVVFDPFD